MRRLLICLCLLALSATTLADNGTRTILGFWFTNDGTAKVQIVNDDGVYGGRIVWLKEPLFPAGDPGGMAGKPKVVDAIPTRICVPDLSWG